MGQWAPDWDLLVNGRPLGAEHRALIESIVVDATIDGADELVIRANAWSSAANEFRILGETVLAPGNLVVVRMGWHSPDGELVTLQRFRMLRERTNYPTGGDTVAVVLRGMSAEHRLVEYTRARKFQPGDLVADIAIEIAEAHGIDSLGVAIDTGAQAARGAVKAKGTSDLQYLQQLAVRLGYGPPYVRYDEDNDTDVLIFETTQLGRRGDPQTFTYNPHVAGSSLASGTCWNFQAELSLANVPTKVQITAWDHIQQEAIQVTVEITDGGQETTVQTGDDVGKIPDELKQGSQLQVAVLTAQDQPDTEKTESLYVGTVKTYDDAVEYAQRWLRTRNEAFMVGRATVKGNGDLWVGQIHTFDGLAPHHNGYWEILGVRHIADAQGYRCDLDLARVIEDDAQQPEEV